MTPTLAGRWQTRFFLLSSFGAAVTLLFVIGTNSIIPLLFLGWTLILGWGWDIIYDYGQQWRWDHDWPPNLQLLAGVLEGCLLAGLAYGLGVIGNLPPWWLFVWHYGTVWLVTFAAGQSVMRLLFPQWRYRGGEWL
ncbi:MAG TPA: hypothetical protein VLL52_20690 [Anaerolineae bacterium]|nr:hypothetical protein [Anaerolineae bacterium]